MRTVDTDVVVLAIAAFHKLPNLKELFIGFGVGQKFRSIPIHKIATNLGHEKASSLPMIHALTGCDTTSFFRGHGKKSCWSTISSLPALNSTMLRISNSTTTIYEDDIKAVERFVILLYDRTSTCTDVNNFRKKLFPKKTLIEQLPPSKAALVEHIKRAAYQAKIWNNMFLCEYTLPNATDWGYIEETGKLKPKWTTMAETWKSCKELVKCGCKKGCRGRCACKKNNLQCTGLCFCEGSCQENIE